MATLYRNVTVKFWEDSKVIDMNVEEKFVFLYLMTNSHTNQACCYELPIKIASRELGLHSEELLKILKTLRDKWKVIDYDEDNSEILVCNRGKYSWSGSESTVASILKDVKGIKNKDFKSYVIFLANHDYNMKTWDKMICDYYIGKWRENKGE